MSLLKSWATSKKAREEAIRREVAQIETSVAVGAEAYADSPVCAQTRRPMESLDECDFMAVTGGVGTDSLGIMRDVCEYIEAGIQVQRVNMNAPELFYAGRHISVEYANRIVDFYYEHGRRPTEAELNG